MYQIVLSKVAKKQILKIKQAKLTGKVNDLLAIIEKDPFAVPPFYEKLMGDFAGAYSRRITYQHRMVYQVVEEEKTIRILSMWTHYEA